jgi:hypothetical protein
MYDSPSATVLPAAALPYARFHPHLLFPSHGILQAATPNLLCPHLRAPGATSSASFSVAIASDCFGAPPNKLTEPVWYTVARGFTRLVSNLNLIVFPKPNREDPGKALRDWDL